MDYSPPGSSVHGTLQAKILECLAHPTEWLLFKTRNTLRKQVVKMGDTLGTLVQGWWEC